MFDIFSVSCFGSNIRSDPRSSGFGCLSLVALGVNGLDFLMPGFEAEPDVWC